jgi:hypothetical protein
LLNRKLLRDLGDVGNPLYSLDVEEMGHGRPAVTVQFSRTSTVAGAPFSGAPTPKNHLGGNGAGEGPSPGDELARGTPVKRVDGGGRQ